LKVVHTSTGATGWALHVKYTTPGRDDHNCQVPRTHGKPLSEFFLSAQRARLPCSNPRGPSQLQLLMEAMQQKLLTPCEIVGATFNNDGHCTLTENPQSLRTSGCKHTQFTCDQKVSNKKGAAKLWLECTHCKVKTRKKGINVIQDLSKPVDAALWFWKASAQPPPSAAGRMLPDCALGVTLNQALLLNFFVPEVIQSVSSVKPGGSDVEFEAMVALTVGVFKYKASREMWISLHAQSGKKPSIMCEGEIHPQSMKAWEAFKGAERTNSEVAKKLNDRVVDTHAKLNVQTLGDEFKALQVKYPDLDLVSTATKGVVDALGRLAPAVMDLVMQEVALYIKGARREGDEPHFDLTWDSHYGGILVLTPNNDLNRHEAFHVEGTLRMVQRYRERHQLQALAVPQLNSEQDAKLPPLPLLPGDCVPFTEKSLIRVHGESLADHPNFKKNVGKQLNRNEKKWSDPDENVENPYTIIGKVGGRFYGSKRMCDEMHRSLRIDPKTDPFKKGTRIFRREIVKDVLTAMYAPRQSRDDSCDDQSNHDYTEDDGPSPAGIADGEVTDCNFVYLK
jgi:hypothetical protein